LLTGKYGCGGGGCGTFTVMHVISLTSDPSHYTVNACLQPICTLHGAAVVTVEGIGTLHSLRLDYTERIARAHGSQCGFYTPGMVMSMYTLLRNTTQPTMEDIREALGGILCRCTGYRPIIDGLKTFCDMSNGLFQKQSFFPTPYLSTQTKRTYREICFHSYLYQLMVNKPSCGLLSFQGERVKLVSPVDLSDLLELKQKYPDAPLVVGNPTIGPKMQVKGVHYPLIIHSGRILELQTPKWGNNGILLAGKSKREYILDRFYRLES
uniref:Aldehyde oxidase 5 n=1 Tax=Esox lucius TaxID=8010 RepID=A0AAY5JYW2_ESOLU